MRWLRQIARIVLGWTDKAYRRWHRLRAVGPMLLVASARYSGPAIRFADGTLLARGDEYGTLHFDNTRIAALGEGGRIRTGVRFARLLRDSLALLADATRDDPGLRSVQAFAGVTWIGDHGGQVGFVSEPLPAGLRRRLLGAHFRLLRWAFAPSLRSSTTDAPEPRMFWLTRGQLLANFGGIVARSHGSRTEDPSPGTVSDRGIALSRHSRGRA